MMLQTIYNSIYFWILSGALVAVLFATSQQHAIKKAETNGAQNLLAKTMVQSGLRILISLSQCFFWHSEPVCPMGWVVFLDS